MADPMRIRARAADGVIDARVLMAHEMEMEPVKMRREKLCRLGLSRKSLARSMEKQ